MAALLLPLTVKISVVASYIADYERYVEACENKNRPGFTCNGSCQLAKEMNAASDPKIPVLPECINTEILPFTTHPCTILQFEFAENTQGKTDVIIGEIKSPASDVPTPPPDVAFA